MNVLAIEGLTAGYEAAPVIRELDLTVGEGEVVALLGANGAGKTTTLRAISGIVHSMSGRIEFAGADLAGMSIAGRAKLGIAHVPESRGLFFGLTVAELRDRRCGLLSGGEQQMLAVARALARRPQLLLLDELSLGLAPLIVERLLPVVKEYATDTGCAVLLVEQHIQLALTIADRGYVLSRGEVVLHDRAEALRGNRDLLMASYFGERSTAALAPESGRGYPES
jgi:ABC-type branched-subunit amino acid transport system ATPase component